MKTPNYRLKVDFLMWSSGWDEKKLPKGAFVRPIHHDYLPRHITNSSTFASYNHTNHIFCYTRFGIVPIPKQHIEEC